jgi:hypothetical protein
MVAGRLPGRRRSGHGGGILHLRLSVARAPPRPSTALRSAAIPMCAT